MGHRSGGATLGHPKHLLNRRPERTKISFHRQRPMDQTPLSVPPRLRSPLATLVFASLVCGGMLIVRFHWAVTLHLSGLFGNLLLAWIPLLLALLIQRLAENEAKERLLFWAAIVLWVLFFPNTFYLVTDLTHMAEYTRDGVSRWYDILLTACYACTGIFLGSLSLYLLHCLVRTRQGVTIGWVFAAGMLALGSCGIYLGRFFRLNSWDVVARPSKMLGKMSGLSDPAHGIQAAAFCLTFFFFSLVVYSFVVAMARMHEPTEIGLAEAKARDL